MPRRSKHAVSPVRSRSGIPPTTPRGFQAVDNEPDIESHRLEEHCPSSAPKASRAIADRSPGQGIPAFRHDLRTASWRSVNQCANSPWPRHFQKQGKESVLCVESPVAGFGLIWFRQIPTPPAWSLVPSPPWLVRGLEACLAARSRLQWWPAMPPVQPSARTMHHEPIGKQSKDSSTNTQANSPSRIV